MISVAVLLIRTSVSIVSPSQQGRIEPSRYEDGVHLGRSGDTGTSWIVALPIPLWRHGNPIIPLCIAESLWRRGFKQWIASQYQGLAHNPYCGPIYDRSVINYIV